MSRYKPYPEYKDSGVEWIGEVPAHWEVASSVSRILSRLVVVPVSELKEQTLFHFSIPVVQETGDGSYQDGVEVQSSKLLIDRPVVLVAKLNPRKGTACKAAPRSGFLTVCSGEFVPLQAKDVGLDYLYYVVSSDAYRQRLEACVESVTRSHQRASPDKVAKFLWAFPPRQEEDQIATFLDRETTRIDTLIEKKQRFIELLEEKRQAVITHAVTKGLDPNVPMKDSGVEWIGEVPAHWEVKKLPHVIRESNSGEVIDKGYWGAGEENLYTCARVSYACNFPGFPSRKRSKTGDLLLTRNGTPYVHEPEPGSIYTNVIQRVRPSESTISEFLAHALRAASVSIISYGVSIESLNFSMWSSLRFPFPPKEEQRAIVSKVHGETTRIDTLIEKTRESIELLKERRAALITAAVTGKIDVREEAAA